MSKVIPANHTLGDVCPCARESIGDSALVENLDGARVQAAGARAADALAGAPLDNGNVDAR